MENPWKLIKAGFWLGIGFIIPTIIVYCVGTLVVYKGMASLWSYGYESIAVSEVSTDRIIINKYQDTRNGNQIIIVGSITNSADRSADSIQLEAEMFDSKGEFIYECSEYISQELNPGKTENFQIKCGCGDNPVPKYDSVIVRVTEVSSY